MNKEGTFSVRVNEATYEKLRKIAFKRRIKMNKVLEESINALLALSAKE